MLSLSLGGSCSVYMIILQLIFEVYSGGCGTSSFGANLVLRCDFPELTAESLGCSLGCLSPPCLSTLCEVSRHCSWPDSVAAYPWYTTRGASAQAQGDCEKQLGPVPLYIPCQSCFSLRNSKMRLGLSCLDNSPFLPVPRYLEMTVPVLVSWTFRMFIWVHRS